MYRSKLGVTCLMLAFLLTLASLASAQLPAPGLVSKKDGNCSDCKTGEYRLTIQQQVPHGDYVYVTHPPCQDDISDILGQLGRLAADAEIAPGVGDLAGPIIDWASDAVRAGVKQNIGGEVGKLLSPYTEPTAQCHPVCAKIPSGAHFNGVALQAGDGQFGTGDCTADANGEFVCSIGWSKFLQPERDKSVVCSVFMNWSHNLERTASMSVYFTPVEGREPVQVRKLGGANKRVDPEGVEVALKPKTMPPIEPNMSPSVSHDPSPLPLF